MNKTIELDRPSQNILASANEHGVSIYIGWEVGIPASTAIEYVRTYNTGTNVGFHESSQNVVLVHGAAKLVLTKQEALAIVDLIKVTYGLTENNDGSDS